MSIPTRPAVAPAGPWAFPDVADTVLDTGLRVRTVDLPGQHVASLRLAVPVPLSAEPEHLEGVALIMARLLDEGSTRHTSEELATLIEGEGIALTAGVGERGLVVDLEVPGHRLHSALDVLAECLTEAVFPEEEVTRAVRARLADITHERADAGVRAAIEFAATYVDGTDRASRPAGGGAPTVRAITAPDVRAFHADVVRPEGATLVVAGDLRGMPSHPRDEARRALGGWSPQETRHPREVLPDPGRRAGDAARLVLVDRPGSAQSELYLGRPGPDRRTPHGWGAYQVLAFLLGGSPQSRIDTVLREERGFTYGMRAGFRPRRTGGVSVVSGAVRAAATVEALELLLQVLELRGADLTEQEVRHGADFVAMTAPGRYATSDAVADEIVRLALDDLDVDVVTQTVDQVRGLTRDRVAAAWEEVRGGPGWTVVVVGDAAEHAAGLGGLGLGAPTVVPADGTR